MMSCTAGGDKSSPTDFEGYTISGKVTGFPDNTMLHLKNLSTESDIDSVYIVDNSFQFKGQLDDSPELVWLYTKLDKKFIYTTLLLNNGEHIDLEADKDDFPWNVQFSGGPLHMEFTKLKLLTKPLDIERDSLVQLYFGLSKDLDEKTRKEKTKQIWDRIRVIDSLNVETSLAYIEKNPNTYGSVIELGYLKKEISKDSLQGLYNRLSPEMKASKYARIIEVFLSEQISEVGDPFHDFEALDPQEKKVKLSSLLENYTLLDFTAAYCGPCIKAKKELKDIAETHSDSLKIISFSGDANKETWLKSLERDEITWMSLWDGKGRFSETSIKYGVQGFPTFFLIDPEGVIVEKWTGYGEGDLLKRLQHLQNQG